MSEANDRKSSRRSLIGFSIAGSTITILFLAFINFYTSPSFPWCFFPAFAVLWWPILTIFHNRRSAKILSLIGSVLCVAFFFLLNYLTSWSYPWFLYPSFAVVWWPLSVFFAPRHGKAFSLIGCAVLIVFGILVNYLTGFGTIWYYYFAFAVIWWPLSVFFAHPKTIRLYSVLGALLLIAFFSFCNTRSAPSCPWALFTYFPALMWPTGVLLGKRLKMKTVSILGCLLGILYYAALNIFVFKGFPWVIFPSYVLCWWPLAVFFARRGKSLSFSLAGFLLSTVFFILVNAVTTPGHIWAVYPLFAIAWWPLSIYYFSYRRRKAAA